MCYLPQIFALLFAQMISHPESFPDIFLDYKKFERKSTVELDRKDQQGWSAVHHLVCPLEYGTYDNVQLLALLHAAGANITAADSAGLTPLDYAFIRGAPRLVKAIQKLMGREKADWVSGKEVVGKDSLTKLQTLFRFKP